MLKARIAKAEYLHQVNSNPDLPLVLKSHMRMSSKLATTLVYVSSKLGTPQCLEQANVHSDLPLGTQVFRPLKLLVYEALNQ